ncbi:MAG: TetR/AcrR family transcriptional regulator, partial [Geminicoccaceae bacterium]|nr:TetR/AcrR family transcriptional regulator [Geminicoccaceae bacterium]
MLIRKPAATRKAEIVEAALRLADELGPDRLTTEAIAGAVGLTQPAIFRHFPTKQDLWEAVGARIGELMEERWAAVPADEGRATDRVRALVATQLGLIQATPAIPAILFSRELHVENQGLRRAFLELMSRFHRLIAGLLAQARDDGELCPELDPDDLAALVIGL